MTLKQTQKYKSVHIDRQTVYIKPSRSIAEVEELHENLKQLAKVVWDTKCKPLFDLIFKNGGAAHCQVTHSYHGNNDPWWKYTVSEYNGFKDIGFNWVKKPKVAVNIKYGQAYYDNDQIRNKFLTRAFKFGALFDKLLNSWLLESGNKPTKYGSVLRININTRFYMFVAQNNQHGVLHWVKFVDGETQIITKSL